MVMLSYGYLAMRVARKAGRHPKYKMAAVVMDGRTIVSVAANGRQRNSHAEKRALARASGGDTLVVARHDGGHSKPCKACQTILYSRGIRQVWYYDARGSFVRATVEPDGSLREEKKKL